MEAGFRRWEPEAPIPVCEGFAADNDSGTLGFYERLLHFLDFDILFLMAQLPSHPPQAPSVWKL